MEITMKRLLVLTTLVSLYAIVASPVIAQEAPASTERACDNCLAIPAPAAKAVRDIAASMVKSTEEVKTSLGTMMKSMEDMKTSAAAAVTKAVEDVKTSILGNSCDCDVPHENK
jgi:hypothetical protein